MGGVIRSVSKVYNYMISVAEVNQNYSKESSPILIHYVMEKPWNVKFPYKTDYPYFKLMWRLGRKMELVKLYILHRLYRIYQLTLVSKEGSLKSASNLNGNLNCSKELEHYAS